MFIKKINKFYAPHHNPKNKTTKTGIHSDIQNKTPSAESIRLKIFSISIDPNGRLIALYSQQTDTIYITSILSLLTLIQNFHKSFSSTNIYSLQSPLPIDLSIQNPRPYLNILQIKFSQSLQNTQFILIAYYNGIVDMYSTVTGKKIDGIDIEQRKAGNDQASSQIYHVNVIGHSLFVSLYNGVLACYEGKQFGVCNRYEGQWIRICYENQLEGDGMEGYYKVSNQGMKFRRVPVYQDKQNRLCQGNKIIVDKCKQKQKQKPQTEQQLSSSYEQYIRLQEQKIAINYKLKQTHIKYNLSLCERYLICRNEEHLIFVRTYIAPSYFTIRVRSLNWKLLPDAKFVNMPVVNHFWGLNSQHSQKEENGQDFMQFCMGSSDIIVAVIGDYSYRQVVRSRGKKTQTKIEDNPRCISIIKLRRRQDKKQKWKWVPELICKLVDAKIDIDEVYWVGPSMLLYLDQQGGLYYMEIQQHLLMS